MEIDKHKWLRILAIAVIGAFNIEILSGWSTLEGFIPWGVLLYGLHLAIIEDVAVRFRLNYKKLFLLGAILGMVMESFFVKTTFSAEFPHDPAWRVFGINFDVLTDVSFFYGHGLFTVLLTFMIVDILLPRRSETPPLSKWHYLCFIAGLLVFYVTGFFWGEGGIPSPESILLMLIIIGFFSSLLIWWIKKGETKKIERTVEKSRSAGVATTLFAFTAALVSYFIQLTNWLSAPFLAYIADNVGAKRRLLVSILLITLLFQGGFFYGAELLAIGVAGVSWAGAIGGIVQITLLLIAIIKLGGMWFEKADTSRWWRVPKYCLFATMQVIVAMGFLIGFILFISFHITLTTMPLGAGGLAFAALGLILTLFWLTTIVRETIGRENPG